MSVIRLGICLPPRYTYRQKGPGTREPYPPRKGPFTRDTYPTLEGTGEQRYHTSLCEQAWVKALFSHNFIGGQ